MNLHEYQAKWLLQKYGIPVPKFVVITSLSEVEAALDFLGLQEAVVKVQVHAGGRGKAGGVRIGKSREELQDLCRQLLDLKIVNNQTGPGGVLARQLIITPLVPILQEFYVAATIDRARSQASLIVSPAGGIEIEEVAEKHPDQILSLPIELSGRLRDYHLIRLAKFLGWSGVVAEKGKEILSRLAKLFVDCDASLLEINPLVLTKGNDLIALDAKISIDDNALYRHQELAAQFDVTQLSDKEIQARQYDLAYVALEGDIGCMVNGAGLAMATMDMIQIAGGKPANFLDVGGGATQDKVAEAFKIILSDPNVKAILVNIFGGIMNCDTLASGIITAASQLQLKVPLIIRMEGTEVEKGRKKLQESALNITIANGMQEAAQLAVEVAKTSH